MAKDRLSSLPDPVISHILSLIPIKYAVRTSVLSNRWKYNFLSVPKIVFDEPRLFWYDESGRAATRQQLGFIRFVNKRLALRKTSPVIEFRLKCKQLPEVLVLDLWLIILLCGNLEVLEIEEPMFSRNPPLSPPTEMFCSDTLRVLKLSGSNVLLKIPKVVYFAKLKVLHLKYVRLHFESDTAPSFSQGYPLLEDLRLESTRALRIIDKATLSISIHSLKKLETISDLGFFRIDIDSPCLEHLICNFQPFSSTMCRSLKFGSCDSIISVDFDVCCEKRIYLGVIRMAKYVKNLRVSKGFSESFVLFPDFLPRLHCLTILDLTAIGKTMWTLLHLAPILEVLVYDMEHMGNLSLPESEPMCLVNSLREIRIRSFNGGKAECLVVRYLMLHAAVLKKMTIDLKRCEIQELPSSVLKQLIGQTRRSPACRIEILERCS